MDTEAIDNLVQQRLRYTLEFAEEPHSNSNVCIGASALTSRSLSIAAQFVFARC